MSVCTIYSVFMKHQARLKIIALSWRRLCLQIVVPLQVHPNQGSGADDSWTGKTLAPSRRTENQPLRHEMRECNEVCPESQFIHGLDVNVVGSIQAHNGCNSSPGSKCASRKRGNRGCGGECLWRQPLWRRLRVVGRTGASTTVYLLCRSERYVCLDAVG